MALIVSLISCVLFWGLFLGIAAALDSRRHRKEMARILALGTGEVDVEAQSSAEAP